MKILRTKTSPFGKIALSTFFILSATTTWAAERAAQCTTDLTPGGVYEARFDGQNDINIMYHFTQLSSSVISIVPLNPDASLDSNAYSGIALKGEMALVKSSRKCSIQLMAKAPPLRVGGKIVSRSDWSKQDLLIIDSVAQNDQDMEVISGSLQQADGHQRKVQLTHVR